MATKTTHKTLIKELEQICEELLKASEELEILMSALPKTIPYDKTKVLQNYGEKARRNIRASYLDVMTLAEYTDYDASALRILGRDGAIRQFTATEAYFACQREMLSKMGRSLSEILDRKTIKTE